jgi:O-antigen ligase
MVVALPFKIFELDRYFVPKELVLHVVALVGAIVLIAKRASVREGKIDVLLLVFIAWNVVSAIFATNHWLAQRALAVSSSSIILFWYARHSASLGGYRSILVGCAVATVVAAAAGIAQTYGIRSDYFSLNRAPGGLFGNRNFVAHVCAIGLPSLLWATVTARRSVGALLGSLGGALVTGALILSRSRAAWLALAACLVVLAVGMFASRKYWRGAGVGPRLGKFVLACTVGACLAIALPNSLNWNSDSPYLDSAKGMVEYKKGSGKGRLAQYENSLKMAVAHPVFGVGPGNWPVQYTRFAPGNDRSLTDDGMTANPWPSSDWVAFVSERGFIAAAALLCVFVALFFGAFRGWSAFDDCEVVLAKLVLAGTISAAMVVTMFDAALLLAAPALLIWSAAGAASGAGYTRLDSDPPRSQSRWALIALFVLTSFSIARSATQIVAMSQVGEGGQRAGWLRGVAWDPGSYRINVRVADLYANRGRCAAAKVYALRARDLFPNAAAPKRILRRCG